MVRRMVPLIIILCAFTLHAESTRFGALGRNDTVVTKESDPIASAAIASETSARQSAVTDLTNKINAESATRTQAFLSVEAQLEALNAKKQDAVVTFLSVDNTGVNVGDSNATGALDNMSDISWIKGPLADFGLGDRAVEPFAITLFRRSGTTTNQNASRILRLLRWNGSAWYVAYQAVSPVVHNDVTINGGRIEHQMEYIAGSARIPADETIVLCYAPAKSSPVTAVLNFGAKVMATTGTRYLATGQSSIPASPSIAAGWPQILAMELTVTEYKNAIAVLASRVEAVAVSAESAQSVAESASVTASAAVATADSAKAAVSTATLTADGARVIAQSAVSTAQSARATAESALAKAASVEKTANAAATASDVAVLFERVTALEGRPSGDASGLSERVAKVESSISTVSEAATAASTAASVASTTAESAKTTATAASATAESAKTTAATAQALAESAASAAEKAQSTASEASTTASAAMAKASFVEKTANAAATAASVANLSDRVTSLENRPSGGVADADLAAETSARKAADADLSARIESVASNAAGKATVATLQAQVATLQSDVSDNTTAISAAQKTASDAAAGVATAQSKANTAASDAATALTRANAAQTVANEAKSSAANAESIANAIASDVDAAKRAADEALTTAESAVAVQATADEALQVANKATTKVSELTVVARTAENTAKTVYDEFRLHGRYDITRHAVNDGSYDSQSGVNTYAHLYTTTPLYFRKDTLGTFNSPLMVALSTGLMLEETPKSSHHGAAIALDAVAASKALGLGEVGHVTSTAWVSPGDWAITVTPAEELTSITNESVVSTNDVGQVIGRATVVETVSQAKSVAVELVDTTATASALPTMTWTCEGASLTVATDTLSAQVSSETPGTYRVIASGADGRSRDAYVSMRAQNKTFLQQTTYMADTAGTARAAANDAILTALQKRDTSSTVASGITSAVCTTDLCFSDYGNNPVASAPLDSGFYCCVEPTSSWGPDAVAVAPHFAVTAAHWNPPQAHSASFRTPDGKAAYIRGTEGFALAQWARENGFSESEIREASLGDIWVWELRWTVDNVNIGTSIPDGCIPYVLDRSGWDYYYGSNLYGIACYAVTQNRYLSWSAFTRDDGAGWAEFGGTYRDVNDNEMVMRSDLRALLSPAKCARIYGGDSGRPIMMIHDGKPVLVSTFHTARSGPSYVLACDILDACIKQRSSGRESLKRISAPVASSEQ